MLYPSYKNESYSFRVFLLFLCLGIFFFSPEALAEESIGSSFEVQIQADKNSSIVKDIQFSPDLNQKYTYTATVTNHESHAIEVSVFPSIAVSTRTSMTYVAETNNLLNKDYDLKKYVKLLPIEGKLEDGLLKIDAKQSKKIKIIINVNKKIIGEVLGGINFSQAIGLQENKDSVNVQQVYQKVIVVRLKQNEWAQETKQIIGDFKFTITGNATTLSYYLYNKNPLVTYAEGGSYRVINPDQEIIAEGEIEQEKIVLSPYIKTMFEAPLLDKAELMSGEYQFVLSDGEDETITYFNYTKEEIDQFIEETTDLSNNVTVKSKVNLWLIIALSLVSFLLIFSLVKLLKNKKSLGTYFASKLFLLLKSPLLSSVIRKALAEILPGSFYFLKELFYLFDTNCLREFFYIGTGAF